MMGVARRLHALLLYCYPAQFRARHGSGMRRDFADALEDARRRGRLALLATVLAWSADALRHGLAERWSSHRAADYAGGWLSELPFDVRMAVRRLLREPGFSLFAGLTLAVGIGGTSAVFVFYSGAFLRPLPYPAAESLVRLEMVDAQGRARGRVSQPDAYDLEEAGALETAALVDYGAVTLAGGNGDAEVIRAGYASPSLFELLGAGVQAGRSLMPEDEAPGASPVALLSDGLWRSRFGADPRAIGEVVEVQGRQHVVVGILPRRFSAPDAALEGPPQIWLPLALEGPLAERGARWLQGIARLAPGMTVASASPALRAAAERLAAAHPATNEGLSIRAVPLRDAMWGDARGPLRILLAASGLVLVIACANLANLLLARGASRGRELAVRTALGAGRMRIARQLLVEHAVLALAGGAAGAGLALLIRNAVRAWASGRLPGIADAPFDGRVFAFTLSMTAMAGLLFGLLPSVRSARSTSSALRENRGGSPGRSMRTAQNILVGTQVALCFALLAGAVLLFEGLRDLARIDPGFDAAQALSWEVTLPASRYPDEARVSAFQTELLERVEALPGVVAAGVVDKLPLGTRFGCASIDVEGAPPAAGPGGPCADSRIASDGYIEAMGISIVAGRWLSPDDGPVTVINETLASSLWPDGRAIGRRIAMSGERADAPAWLEVIGVIADIRHRGPLQAPLPEMYMPWPASVDRRMSFVIRSTGDPAALVAPVRAVLRVMDDRIPPRGLQPLNQALAATLAAPRNGAIAFAILGALALFLAVIGLYGVLSWFVSRRAPEIGIRMALGARADDIVRMVLGEAMRTVGAALIVGTALAIALGRVLSRFLHAADHGEAATFAMVALLLLAVATAACAVPARRALRSGPAAAMRNP